MNALDKKVLAFMRKRGSDVNALMLMTALRASSDDVLASLSRLNGTHVVSWRGDDGFTYAYLKPTHRCSCGWEGLPRKRAGFEPMCARCGNSAEWIS